MKKVNNNKFYDDKITYIRNSTNGVLLGDRPWLSYKEQFQKLSERNLKIDESSRCVFEKIHYYKLINGYKEFFIKNKTFKNEEDDYLGSSFQDIVNLYHFDENLKLLLLNLLLKFEVEFKSTLSYVFMKHHTPYGYIDIINSFERQIIPNTKNKSLKDLIEEDIISPITSAEKRTESIKHFIDKKEVIPFYALIGSLSFGNVVNFYKYMFKTEREEISKHFNYSNVDMFGKLLGNLRKLRNICAHFDRLFNYKFLFPNDKAKKLYDCIIDLNTINTQEVKEINNNIMQLLKDLKEKIEKRVFIRVLKASGYYIHWFKNNY